MYYSKRSCSELTTRISIPPKTRNVFPAFAEGLDVVSLASVAISNHRGTQLTMQALPRHNSSFAIALACSIVVYFRECTACLQCHSHRLAQRRARKSSDFLLRLLPQNHLLGPPEHERAARLQGDGLRECCATSDSHCCIAVGDIVKADNAVCLMMRMRCSTNIAAAIGESCVLKIVLRGYLQAEIFDVLDVEVLRCSQIPLGWNAAMHSLA